MYYLFNQNNASNNCKPIGTHVPSAVRVNPQILKYTRTLASQPGLMKNTSLKVLGFSSPGLTSTHTIPETNDASTVVHRRSRGMQTPLSA
jgi:hypothetical protein